MTQQTESADFTFAPFVMLFLPYAAIAYFGQKHELLQAGFIAAIAITCLSSLLFLVRNWAELLAGMLASLMLIALLAACAMIPVIGWIADALIILYAFASVLSSISALMPYALKAMALWAVFLISLLPAIFHPIASPIFICLVTLGMGSAMAKNGRGFDNFVLLLTSIPLLGLAIASLGKLLSSGIVMRNAQFRQDVSGYTTKAGVQVGDYTRTVTKTIPTVTTSVNPGAAAIGSAAGKKAKQDVD